MAQLHFEDLFGGTFNVKGGATATATMQELPETQPDWIVDDWPEDLAVRTQISTDQPFKFIVTWQQEGPLSKGLNPKAYWQIEVLMEKMGAGEYELPDTHRLQTEPYQADENAIYLKEFTIPRRTIPAGVYRPVVMVNLRLPGPGDTWMPVAGFAEFPPIQVYED